MSCEDCLSCRNVLWCLVFTGCGINYMVRTNLNIAIVAMVLAGNTTISQYQEATGQHLNITNYTVPVPVGSLVKEPQYDWNEYEQGQVLGAFFWTYWMGQLPGGILAQKYGTKKVFGFSNLFICLTTFLIPLCSKMNILALIALRMLQGLIGGLAWPSLHDMTAKWIPPNERSKFVTAYMGSSVGAALTYPLCGLIIYYCGWRAVFYISGTIGVVWTVAWWKLVYDSPADHPYISGRELRYIQSSLYESVSKKKLPIPWLRIVLSGPLWILIAAHWGCLWGMFTLLTQAPTYFQNVHGWSIRMTGLLSGVPHFTRVILALGVSYACDYILKKNFSYTTTRKIGVTISSTLQGVLMLGLAFSGSNAIGAIICFTVATTLTGAEAPGPLASYCDLSPNFASVVMGVGNMITVMPGFISPIIVGVLTYHNQSPDQWQVVFLISAAMAIVPGLLYLCCGSSEVQPWNSNRAAVSEELQNLSSKLYHNKFHKLEE